LPHAAVQFALAHPAVASVVLGGVHPSEVSRNLAALKTDIPTALWSDLKTESLLESDAPTP
jgi:D-threo-aldose 1-dehydrogenase